MKVYSNWFFENHVLPHFKLEEEYLFPVLGQEHEMVKKSLAEHRRLERLFKDNKDISRSLSLIEEELELHVRYEKRELFNEIQKQASPEQLKIILEVHKDELFQDNTKDEFWK
jgi:iron-sulfur cluster repair protein YtfE (RIC family)